MVRHLVSMNTGCHLVSFLFSIMPYVGFSVIKKVILHENWSHETVEIVVLDYEYFISWAAGLTT